MGAGTERKVGAWPLRDGVYLGFQGCWDPTQNILIIRTPETQFATSKSEEVKIILSEKWGQWPVWSPVPSPVDGTLIHCWCRPTCANKKLM